MDGDLLPSEISNKNSLFYSSTTVNEDLLEKKGGKWLLYTPSDIKRLDHLWVIMKQLCDNGTLTAIKSSTATDQGDCVILCYTPDSENVKQIKKAADEIRKVIDFDNSMYYKATKYSIGTNNEPERKGVYIYVHTVTGEFYEKENYYLLPSENYWRNQTSYHSTWIDRKERGGKWILHSYGNKSDLDRRWVALRNLCDNGTLIGIRSSTSIATGRKSTICYTLDAENREEVKKAAEEIRGLIHYEYIMNYVANKSLSTSGRYRVSESGKSSKYIHTVRMGFYEKDKYMRWISL